MSNKTFVYSLSQDQIERVEELMAHNGGKTPNEKMEQIFERGLTTLEREIKQRAHTKELIQLGRKMMKENKREHFAGETMLHLKEVN